MRACRPQMRVRRDGPTPVPLPKVNCMTCNIQMKAARESVFAMLVTLANFFELQGLSRQSAKPNEFPYELLRNPTRGANANIVVIAATTGDYARLMEVTLTYLHKFRVSDILMMTGWIKANVLKVEVIIVVMVEDHVGSKRLKIERWELGQGKTGEVEVSIGEDGLCDITPREEFNICSFRQLMDREPHDHEPLTLLMEIDDLEEVALKTFGLHIAAPW